MKDRMIYTFFYGSFINPDVLKQANFIAHSPETAKLYGYDIIIKPFANLIRSEEQCVYGILASSTPAELSRLYAAAKSTLQLDYLPEAVLAETNNGKLVPALCYICPEMKDAQPSDEYIDKIFKPAQTFGFPDWYLNKLNSFRPVDKKPGIQNE